MSPVALRVAVAVFVVGALGAWLVKPIGDACPDVGRLPAGSQSSSSPSFAPPLTRTCTYTTVDGTQARKRYVPIVDWLVLGVVAGVAGVGVGLAGPGREPRPERAPRAPKAASPSARRAPRIPAAQPAPPESAEERALAREREREERARRRHGG